MKRPVVVHPVIDDIERLNDEEQRKAGVVGRLSRSWSETKKKVAAENTFKAPLKRERETERAVPRHGRAVNAIVLSS